MSSTSTAPRGDQERQVAGAAVDVFPDEPEKNGDPFTSVLQGLPNVILTPHIGGSTEEAQANIGLDVTSKLVKYLELGISEGSHTVSARIRCRIRLGRTGSCIFTKIFPGILSQINSKPRQARSISPASTSKRTMRSAT